MNANCPILIITPSWSTQPFSIFHDVITFFHGWFQFRQFSSPYPQLSVKGKCVKWLG